MSPRSFARTVSWIDLPSFSAVLPIFTLPAFSARRSWSCSASGRRASVSMRFVAEAYTSHSITEPPCTWTNTEPAFPRNRYSSFPSTS